VVVTPAILIIKTNEGSRLEGAHQHAIVLFLMLTAAPRRVAVMTLELAQLRLHSRHSSTRTGKVHAFARKLLAECFGDRPWYRKPENGQVPRRHGIGEKKKSASVFDQ